MSDWINWAKDQVSWKPPHITYLNNSQCCWSDRVWEISTRGRHTKKFTVFERKVSRKYLTQYTFFFLSNINCQSNNGHWLIHKVNLYHITSVCDFLCTPSNSFSTCICSFVEVYYRLLQIDIFLCHMEVKLTRPQCWRCLLALDFPGTSRVRHAHRRRPAWRPDKQDSRCL